MYSAERAPLPLPFALRTDAEGCSAEQTCAHSKHSFHLHIRIFFTVIFFGLKISAPQEPYSYLVIFSKMRAPTLAHTRTPADALARIHSTRGSDTRTVAVAGDHTHSTLRYAPLCALRRLFDNKGNWRIHISRRLPNWSGVRNALNSSIRDGSLCYPFMLLSSHLQPFIRLGPISALNLDSTGSACTLPSFARFVACQALPLPPSARSLSFLPGRFPRRNYLLSFSCIARFMYTDHIFSALWFIWFYEFAWAQTGYILVS